jgi:DNA-binding XRE family transcriptional regulator
MLLANDTCNPEIHADSKKISGITLSMKWRLNIKAIREDRHVTHDELAAHLGVKKLAVYSWETDKKSRKRPNADQVCAIAEFLRCAPGDLFEKVSPKAK